jgi:uncharacterized protein with PIN domain
MAEETDRAGWGEASQAVEEELRTWQRSHRLATLTEIEVAVEAATAKLQARLIQDLAQDMDQTAMVDPPSTCPTCGGRLQRRGRRERAVVVAHQQRPLRLEREYLWCPACGAGLSPPG